MLRTAVLRKKLKFFTNYVKRSVRIISYSFKEEDNIFFPLKYQRKINSLPRPLRNFSCIFIYNLYACNILIYCINYKTHRKMDTKKNEKIV